MTALLSCQVSGLSDWFGEQLATFQHLDPWLINLVICIAVAMATEITSNTATATLLMPIMAELVSGEVWDCNFFRFDSSLCCCCSPLGLCGVSIMYFVCVVP